MNVAAIASNEDNNDNETYLHVIAKRWIPLLNPVSLKKKDSRI